MEDFHSLLKKLDNSRMSYSAYDTAWVARLDEFDPEMGNTSLEWLSKNQNSNGSWGCERPMYYHDLVISTLCAMIALTHRGRRARDKVQIEKGLKALEEITIGTSYNLAADRSGETVGFELIVPTLVTEAENLGIIKQQKENLLDGLGVIRAAKLKRLQGQKISRLASASQITEMTGTDRIDLLDIDNLQEINGSVGNSPSASAHFALYVKPGDESALNYLRRLSKGSNGGFRTADPIDIFDRIWVLWNLSLTGLHKTDNEIKALCAPHLDYLEKYWQPGRGVSFSESFPCVDGDDTAVAFDVLSTFGRKSDLSVFAYYEEENWFRCYEAERNPSIDTNIDFLGAFHQVGYDKEHPSIKKILAFIRSTRKPEGYWLDKWNISAYYTAGRALIQCREYDDELCQDVAKWMLSEQQANGSWGSYGFQSAEETAYCLQSLKLWQIYGGNVPKDALEKAKLWLSRNCEPPYPSFWIAKTSYCPVNMVQSAIISALVLAEQ